MTSAEPQINAWQQRPSLTQTERLDVLNLLNRTEDSLGREAIDEGRRRSVVHGWPAEHWLRYEGEVLVEYAHLSGADIPTLELCGGGFSAGLLSALLTSHSTIDWWIREIEPPAIGSVVRTLQLMRIAITSMDAEIPSGATLRNFEPGRDDAAWLEQNNAAFSHHPEQGAWRNEDLAERTHEPWFDSSSFLLLEFDGRLAASCWTKVNELNPQRFGEIYIISVHPDFQGRGLGRVMVLQGLASLRRRGVNTGILFVDKSNIPAKELYENLGFTVVRNDHLVRFSAED